jgi:hypothetical protein
MAREDHLAKGAVHYVHFMSSVISGLSQIGNQLSQKWIRAGRIVGAPMAP